MKKILRKLFFLFPCIASFNPATAQPVAIQEIKESFPVIILGGGICSLTSALYLARAGLNPLVVEGPTPGGLITQSQNIQNWPGEIEISGIELVEKMVKQSKANGVQFLEEEVIDIDFSEQPFTVTVKNLLDPLKTRQLKAMSIIIGMGSTPNFLKIPGEKEYWTKGVYNCAHCDGALFKDQHVAVIGGSDAAVLDAQYLSHLAKNVHVFVRKDSFRGIDEQRKQELLKTENVIVHFNTIVDEILGDGQKVTKIKVSHTQTNDQKEIPIDGVFLAIGSHPNTSLFENKLQIDDKGYLKVDQNFQTSVKGVFAVGDIVDPIYRQAITAAGDGAKAAIQAERFLNQHQLLASRKTESFSTSDYATKLLQVIEIKDEKHFEKEIQHSHVPILIDFYATWCGPCKRLAPLFDSTAEQMKGKVKFLKVNVQHMPHLSRKYGVSSVPTVILMDQKGKWIDKKIGTIDISLLLQTLNQMDNPTIAQIDDLFRAKKSIE